MSKGLRELLHAGALQDFYQGKRILVTGGAGFIGSHICDALLQLGSSTVVIDNLSTGFEENINFLKEKNLGELRFIKGDINEIAIVDEAFTKPIDIVFHQAALGSVPRSFDDPWASSFANVQGFIRLCEAARSAGAQRIVYASSSSVYGDIDSARKREGEEGQPLSPYALTKCWNEDFSRLYSAHYPQLALTGLRYFNVFGPRQSPEGPYSAVIPRWIGQLQRGEVCTVFGDGTTSRDFCFVDNVVYANLLAGMDSGEALRGKNFNIAGGEQVDLLTLYQAIIKSFPNAQELPQKPHFSDFRPGDVRHSLADLSAATNLLGYETLVGFEEGIERTVAAMIST